jgi:hypothetical protein
MCILSTIAVGPGLEPGRPSSPTRLASVLLVQPDTDQVPGAGFEPASPEERGLQPRGPANCPTPAMEREGIEPSARGSSNHRSTSELPLQINSERNGEESNPQLLRRPGFQDQLAPTGQTIPGSDFPSDGGGIRTLTDPGLSRSPLPVGIPRRAFCVRLGKSQLKSLISTRRARGSWRGVDVDTGLHEGQITRSARNRNLRSLANVHVERVVVMDPALVIANANSDRRSTD